jgi:hypothetical protein
MTADRLNRWLTLVANVGVLAGLLLVAYEIRQSAGIATAQARLEYSAGWRSVDGSRQDRDFAAVIAKSIESPESLTLTERIQLDGFYIGIVDQAYSAYVAWIGGVRPNHYDSAIAAAVELNMGSPYAKAWWQANRASWDDEEFMTALDRAIEAEPADSLRRYYDGPLDELRAESAGAGNGN